MATMRGQSCKTKGKFVQKHRVFNPPVPVGAGKWKLSQTHRVVKSAMLPALLENVFDSCATAPTNPKPSDTTVNREGAVGTTVNSEESVGDTTAQRDPVAIDIATKLEESKTHLETLAEIDRLTTKDNLLVDEMKAAVRQIVEQAATNPYLILTPDELQKYQHIHSLFENGQEKEALAAYKILEGTSEMSNVLYIA
eukprot:351265_1